MQAKAHRRRSSQPGCVDAARPARQARDRGHRARDRTRSGPRRTATGRHDPETFGKLRRQASLQVRGRTSDEPIHELLAHKPPIGFAQLPRPAAGDVFFDMEGDPLFEPGRGLEYLFGCWMPDEPEPFCAYWGLDRDQERGAFQAFIDFITERRKQYPAMHVYHYAPYEKVALRKLAQLHCTREDALDDLCAPKSSSISTPSSVKRSLSPKTATASRSSSASMDWIAKPKSKRATSRS